MTNADYRKIGVFVYGVHRLAGVITILGWWFRGGDGNGEIDGNDPEFKHDEIAQASQVYFLTHPAHACHEESLLRIMKTVHTLHLECSDIVQKDKVDEYVDSIREAHYALADIVDKLGCEIIDTKALRKRCLETLG